jgi:adenine/guanine phosphoribosyltransferase-like PRPP-binding protein
MGQARPARVLGGRRLFVVAQPAGLALGAAVLGLPLRHPGLLTFAIARRAVVPPTCSDTVLAGPDGVFSAYPWRSSGTARLAEGADVAGRRVLGVEDVVTSGGQVVLSTGQLRELGATVTDALCVIDRGEGGTAALAGHGIALRALLTRADLDAARRA